MFIKLSPELLNTKLDPIEQEDFKEVFCLAVQSQQWLRNKNAYAIASNQIDIPHRFFVVKNSKSLGLPTDIFFNPTYVPKTDNIKECQEGCLSYSGVPFKVTRWEEVELFYYDPRLKERKSILLKGLPAQIVQHEVDHNDGITDVYTEAHPKKGKSTNNNKADETKKEKV
jgi:peptide deformylase